MNIQNIWNNILEHAGETFTTVTGLKFTYVVVDDHTIRPYRDGNTRWDLSKNLFEKALSFSPSEYSSAKFNNSIIGSAYVRALLLDKRILRG